MCTREDTLAHILGVWYIDDVSISIYVIQWYALMTYIIWYETASKCIPLFLCQLLRQLVSYHSPMASIIAGIYRGCIRGHIMGPYKPYPKQDSNLGSRAFSLLEFEIPLQNARPPWPEEVQLFFRKYQSLKDISKTPIYLY